MFNFTIITTYTSTSIDNVFLNVIDLGLILDNLNGIIPDYRPPFETVPSMSSNITSSKSNIYEIEWYKLDQKNLSFNYFSIAWDDLLKTKESNVDNTTKICLDSKVDHSISL